MGSMGPAVFKQSGAHSILFAILLNPDGALWVKRMSEGFTRLCEVPLAQAASALSTIAAWRGTVLNHEQAILETELPIDGSRFEGIVSPVVRRPIVAIRLRPRRILATGEPRNIIFSIPIQASK
jgi:Flp pilus assembly CpaF family ATPase